jgi:hypothetical protein
MNADCKISREVVETIQRAALSFVASTNADGSANVAPIASLDVHDDHVTFANMASSTTVANLQRDPRIMVVVIDVFRRRGFRLRGAAQIHAAGTNLYAIGAERIWSIHGRQYPVHEIVSITVHAVSPVLSPAYRFGSMSAEEIEEAFLHRYGVQRLAEPAP